MHRNGCFSYAIKNTEKTHILQNMPLRVDVVDLLVFQNQLFADRFHSEELVVVFAAFEVLDEGDFGGSAAAEDF